MTFQAGKQYTSADGTLKADIVCVRRGTHSTRVIVLAMMARRSGARSARRAAQRFSTSKRGGVYVITSGKERL